MPYGPSISVQWSPAEDPFLRDMSIDDTTIILRPMTEKSLNGKLQFDAVFADGLAKSKSEVEYYLVPDEEEEHSTTDAKPLYTYPDSTEFNVLFPAANKYYSKDTNWQSDLYVGLEKDKLYLLKARASKEIDGELVTGKEVTSDSFGNVASETREDGCTASYAYNEQNKLVSATNYNGAVTTYEYDGAGNIAAVNQPDGSRITYTSDELHRITSMTDGRGITTTYSYDGANLTSYTDGEGGLWSYAYDAMNRAVSQTDPLGNEETVSYNANGDVTARTAAGGGAESYSLDAAGNILSVTDALGNTTAFTYDAMYNMTQAVDANGHSISYEYDKNNQEIRSTDAKGNTIASAYDKMGRLISEVNEDFGVRQYEYDAADNVVKETDSLKSVDLYTYDRPHRMVSSTNALEGTSHYKYDRYGNLLETSDPLGRTENYTYDLAGRMVEAADPMGKMTAFAYDPAGNVTAVTKPGGRKTSYGYDGNYNITSVTDPMGYAQHFVYDKSSRLTEETDALKQKVSYGYDKDGRVTEVTNKLGHTVGFEYDPHGNILTAADRTGLKTHYEYDPGDNLTKVTDPLGGTASYAYDSMDQMVSYTDAAGKKTEYAYDLEGNLTSLKDPAGRTENFAYDGKGRLTAHTYASGKTVSYDYDKLNDLLEKSYEDAKGGKSEEAVTYAYNTAGERVSMKDGTGKSSYEYDELGRIVKVTNGSGKAVGYAYDEADNLSGITYPDGTKVSYAYDLNDNLVKVTDRDGHVTEYKHDALNRVTETVRPDGTKTKVTYDAEDHVTKPVNTCGTCGEIISSYEYRYNEQGYVTAEDSTELEAGTRKTPSFSDWYNWGGRKIKEDSRCCHEEKTVKTSRTYEYDGNWELVRCTEKAEGGGKTVHNYTYDKAGNRTVYERVEDGVQTVKYKYTYNDSNQLVKKVNCRIWGDKGACYKYDADGNLVTSQENTYEDPVKYEYTAENRLKAVSQGGTVLMAAMYDGDNNRVFQIDNTYKWEDCYGKEVLIPQSQRTEDGDSPKEQLASVVKGGANAKGYTLTEYVNDINRENAEALMEYGADEKVRKAYVYGEERVSVDKTGENSYYLYNGQGSVTGLLKENGKLTNSYRYDPYGSLALGTPDAVNYYGYNGESSNVKTGFQYLRARYYNPSSGTFTSEDPYLGTQTEPLSRNRYAYTQNNPVNYTDPAGYARGAKTARSSRKGGMAGVVAGVTKSAVSVGKSTSVKVQSAVTGAKAVQAAKSNSSYRKSGSQKTNISRATSTAVSTIAEVAKQVRMNVIRELCSSGYRVKTKGQDVGNALKVTLAIWPKLIQASFSIETPRPFGYVGSAPIHQSFLVKTAYKLVTSGTPEQYAQLAASIMEIAIGVLGAGGSGAGTLGTGGAGAIALSPLLAASLGLVTHGSAEAGKVLGELIQSAEKNSEEKSGKTVKDSDTLLPEQAGRGQSRGGRHEPGNLKEKLAMEEAMTNPENGRILKGKNTDKRWPAEDGWEKWAQNVNGYEIHYEYNPLTGEIDDVKIKFPD